MQKVSSLPSPFSLENPRHHLASVCPCSAARPETPAGHCIYCSTSETEQLQTCCLSPSLQQVIIPVLQPHSSSVTLSICFHYTYNQSAIIAADVCKTDTIESVLYIYPVYSIFWSCKNTWILLIQYRLNHSILQHRFWCWYLSCQAHVTKHVY